MLVGDVRRASLGASLALLVVVGRQPGVGLGHERLEVAPRLARRPAQQRPLAIAERPHARHRPAR